MTLVFTNGCFDLLHAGHVDLLNRARALGDRLVVGINSDASVRALKGPSRPLVPQEQRRAVLLGLRAVDDVVVFDELTPERLITELKPDVLVKGGDWKPEMIAGASFVQARGGRVCVLPVVEGLSTTSIVQKLIPEGAATAASARVGPDETHVVGMAAGISEHQNAIAALRSNLLTPIHDVARTLVERLRAGRKLLVAGNGGSAADAQHLAAELMVRFRRDRGPLPAVALTTDSSLLTAHGNDFGYETVFARQVEGLAAPGDVFVGISTSGRSPNVLAACRAARARGCHVVGLTGGTGGDMASLCHQTLCVPSSVTARVQEMHILIIHLWCEFVDEHCAGARS